MGRHQCLFISIHPHSVFKGYYFRMWKGACRYFVTCFFFPLHLCETFLLPCLAFRKEEADLRIYHQRLQEQKEADDQKVREKEQLRQQQRQHGVSHHGDEGGGSPSAVPVPFHHHQPQMEIPAVPSASAAVGAAPPHGPGRACRHRSKHVVDASWLDAVAQPAAPQPGPVIPDQAHPGR